MGSFSWAKRQMDTFATILCRGWLYAAMKRAGIPRAGANGATRSFHSFRHTFAKRAMERGLQLTWLQRQLGHSTIQVTNDIYGHWEFKERKAQIQLLGELGEEDERDGHH
jgi:integrase